jgi:hypothetical protein
MADVGDKLFTDDEPDWSDNACLNWGGDWHVYVSGFRQGARKLVDEVARTQADQDFLVYPIVFAYRQYLELVIKTIIVWGRRLRDVPVEIPRTHRLLTLWRNARRLLEEIYPNDSTDGLEAVEETIAQFATVDDESFAFRYPVRTDGRPSLPLDLVRFNLRHFAEQIEAAGNLLEGAVEGIEVNLDYKAEMASF